MPITAFLPNRALLLMSLMHIAMSSIANDIQVTNVTLANTDLGQGTTSIQFDISWENSWRGGGVINWDAAWVFVKYKQQSGVWQHVRLSASGHVAPAGSQIDLGLLTPGTAHNATTNPVIGVFLRRDADGSGTFSGEGVQLRWDFGALGLAFNDIIEVKVFAIEMAYVNQGTFAMGSGGAESPTWALTTINTANSSVAPSGTGSLGGQAGGRPTGAFASNATYPNGFSAFYSMKYEIAQQQYVDFLNTLTRPQQHQRTLTDLSPGITTVTNTYVMRNQSLPGVRNGIRCPGTINADAPIVFFCDLNGNGIGGEADDGQWKACNFISGVDVFAYLAWAGLRPMSEMEFEKSCRGPLLPVANEFAWGTTTIRSSASTLVGAGSVGEGFSIATYSTDVGNAAYISTSNSNGPFRTGIFAGHPNNTGRLTSGAGYYGTMELSGNLQEFVTAVNDNSFQRTAHGNGLLDANALAIVPSWPTYVFVPAMSDWDFDNNYIVTRRGGFWSGSMDLLRVSTRGPESPTVLGFGISRTGTAGGRGVRTAQ